jgi:hypothetical protein
LAHEQAARFVPDDLEMMRAGLAPWLGGLKLAGKVSRMRL